MGAVRDRGTIILPAAASVGLGLGALIYAGGYGANCDGTHTTPVMAHPPFAWPWYAALAVVLLSGSLVPLLRERRCRHRS
jgi:hypothetical protein